MGEVVTDRGRMAVPPIRVRVRVRVRVTNRGSTRHLGH